MVDKIEKFNSFSTVFNYVIINWKHKLDEKSLKNIQINDLRFMGGASKVPENWANCMTHIFTFENRLTITFCYTYPALSRDWANEFFEQELTAFKFFASSSDSDMTLDDFLNKELYL